HWRRFQALPVVNRRFLSGGDCVCLGVILTYLLDGGGQKRPTGLEMMMHFHPRSFSLKNTSPSSTRAATTATATTTTTAYCMEGVRKLRHSKCHNWCGMKSSQAKNSNNNGNDDYNDSQRQFTVEFSSVVCCQVVYNIQLTAYFHI
uniref:Uncharacterized protein n=1 Tax=Glossina pallidipes TaxID=7398 RepID=A0A1A9ZIY7_GLOPL